MKVKKKKKEEFKEFRNNNKSEYKTIKIPLKTILLNNLEIQPQINNLVFEMNDLVIHTYQFIRLYILNLYNKNQQLPTMDVKFISYCLKTLGSRSNSGAKFKDSTLFDELNLFYQTEYQTLLNHSKTNLIRKKQILAYIATKIHTAYQNNIKEHFIQHFLRFINKTTTDITEDKSILFHFKNKCLFLEETDIIFDDWKQLHINNILPTNIKQSIHYDVKIRPFEYLKGMLYMNSILEKQDHKLFQPLPLRNNIIPKHILLDTALIITLFSPETDKNGKKTKIDDLLNSVTENQKFAWENFLNMENKIFKNKHYQFHNQIQTDGISCSLTFIRKDLIKKDLSSDKKDLSSDKKVRKDKKESTSTEQEFHNIEDLPVEQLDVLKSRNLVGCDPGKHSLVYMMDKKGNKLEYTASQRKMESYGKRNQRILLQEKKKHKITEKETIVSLQNSKSVNYFKFKEYLVEKDKLNKDTTDFYKREVWRKMKFRQYSYGNKSIDTFLNKIKDTFGENLLIGYGNWSRSTQMKHIMPTMNKGLRKLIHKKYDTITINECYTSQKCCGCLQPLKHCKDKTGVDIYRLFTCSGCVSYENKNVVFRTRDKNSAINILNLTESWINFQTRPVEFQCVKKTTPFTCVKSGLS